MHTLITTIFFVTQMSINICVQNFEANLEQQPYYQTHLEGVKESDFELVGGLIFLEAEIDGNIEKFILDTGSPHLMLNNNSKKSKRTSFVLNGVGGTKKIFREKNVDFNWNGIKIKKEESYSVDLGNIEAAKDKKFFGLIGYDQVRKHELVIDYERKKVFLISKNNQKEFFKNYEKTEKIWCRMVGHLPIVKVKIGKRKYYFGIDTGAEMNVIDKRLKKRISEEMISNNFSTSLMGGNEKGISVTSSTINEIKIGKSYYKNMTFAFADLSFLTDENGVAIDGLLGYPFLKSAKFSIDFRKKQLNKWQLKTPKNDFVELAITKKNIQITTPLFDDK